MRSEIVLALVAAFAVLNSSVFGLSDIDREVKLLQDQHDKDLADAKAAIEARLTAGLERLLEKAKQDADIAAATRIMELLGKVDPANPGPRLGGTRWVTMDKATTIEFKADKTFCEHWHGDHFAKWEQGPDGVIKVAGKSYSATTFRVSEDSKSITRQDGLTWYRASSP
jgi:uncharacterized protein